MEVKINSHFSRIFLVMNTSNYINKQLLAALTTSRDVLEGYCPEIVDCIDCAMSDLYAPIQLAIIGKISSSKSTLVNAILGASDVVATGNAELTYNVNWLKYGGLEDDIIIWFKDGTHETKPRTEWTMLANRISDEEATENEVLKQYVDKIKYIEVPYPAEILKYVNIIDTPGLYSYYRKDSENTLSFLKEVKPDAVVMLFVKSILSEDMETLSTFQEKTVGRQQLFRLSPLNAIGMLAKMDENWKATEQNSPYDISLRVVENLKRDYPELTTTFFDIQPMSALLGLATVFVETDRPLLQQLSALTDEQLANLVKSKRHFLTATEVVEVSQEALKRLLLHYGLYGVYAMVCFIKLQPDCSVADLITHLEDISGFKRFRRMLFAHFRDRAVLIKAQNSVHAIIDQCEAVRKVTIDETIIERINQVQIKIMTSLMSIHEYAEWCYLLKIYNGEFNHLEQSMTDEYKTICGENGNSVIRKLGLAPNSTVEEMQAKSAERASYWNMQYNVARIRKPQDAELCKVMATSYKVLGQRIAEMAQQEREAKEIINQAHAFFYGE